MVVFQKTLYDIVKGIRSQRRDPSSFISESIAEIKRELQEIDTSVKAEAIRKLTYIQMMGYNVSWASFSIMEVMSQARFDHKRIGYLAANQVFSTTVFGFIFLFYVVIVFHGRHRYSHAYYQLVQKRILNYVISESL